MFQKLDWIILQTYGLIILIIVILGLLLWWIDRMQIKRQRRKAWRVAKQLINNNIMTANEVRDLKLRDDELWRNYTEGYNREFL